MNYLSELVKKFLTVLADGLCVIKEREITQIKLTFLVCFCLLFDLEYLNG